MDDLTAQTVMFWQSLPPGFRGVIIGFGIISFVGTFVRLVHLVFLLTCDDNSGGL